jgi:hypothetical protein
MRFITIAIIVSVLVGGCSTTVKLTVHNGELYPVESNIEVFGKNGGLENEIGLGPLDKNTETTKDFDVKNGGSFSVKANLPTSAIIFDSNKISVTGKEDPFIKNVTVRNQGEILDDSKAFEAISRSFKNMGNDLGALPLDLKNALDTRVGSLVVAVPSENGQAGKILYSISPNILGVSVMNLDAISFPGTNETEAVKISGNAALTANATIGAVGSFGVNWSKDSVYEMKWVLRGFGVVQKTEDASKDPATKINALSEEHKKAIKAALKGNSKAKLYYINSFYVLKQAELFIKEGVKQSAKADFASTNIVTSVGVFNFEKAQEKNKGYGPVVLNYWGDEYLGQEVNEPANTTATLSSVISGLTSAIVGVPPASPSNKNTKFVMEPTGRKLYFSTKGI